MPKLTHERILKTQPPEKGSRLIFDAGPDRVRGFGCRIFANGVRSYRTTIGQHPTWSVQAARLRAKELRQQVDAGRDPAKEKREARDAPTVADLISRYVADVLPARHLNPKRRRAVDRVLATIAAGLGERRRVVDVHFGDVEQLHRRTTAAHGPVAANRLISFCNVLFALALKPMADEVKPWRDAVLGNPCRGVKRNAEHSRERFFSAAELAAISDALNEWVHKLPLSPSALELVGRLRQRRGAADFVFGLSDISRCWEMTRDRAGLGKSARLYDLRHSFASVGAGGGLSLQIIGRLLGHTQARTTQRYSHLADDPLREAADRIGAVYDAATNGNGSNVTPISRGRRS